MRSLLDYRRNGFSQNGEEGVINHIFDVIGAGTKMCCEFGAWDGIHLSNTRALILDGWSGLLIEGDPERFKDLLSTYQANKRIVCENSYVDAASNSLARIVDRNGLSDRRMDLLSIDIDGLDFDIFSSLDQLKRPPRLVVVEVQPGHSPTRTTPVPPDVPAFNVGQPLSVFARRGREIGYRLICYLWCNAFFLQDDEGTRSDLPEVTPLDAWQSSIELIKQSRFGPEWLFRYNLGLSYAKYKFDNEFLTAENLGIQPERAHWLATAPLTDDLQLSWKIAVRRQLRRLLRISKAPSIGII